MIRPGTQRNSIADKLGALVRLADFGELKDFSCGDADLDEFFSKDARVQQAKLLSTTYCYRFRVDGGLSVPVAVVSVLNDAIRLKPDKREACALGDVPYCHFPAVKVGRLGVHEKLAGRGIGTHVLNLVKTLFVTENRTGCRFLTVDAYNKTQVTNFYQKNEFDFYSAKDARKDSRQMVFDLMPFANGLHSSQA